jgi:predicted phosphodiesterase
VKFLLLAAAVANAGVWFDGNSSAPSFTPPPRTPAAVALAVKRPEPIPNDLYAAAARLGHAAMIASLPARGNESFSFGVLGDAEPGRFWWERIFNPGENSFIDQWRNLQDTGIDFTLQLGDFVSRGNVMNYRDHVGVIVRWMRKPILRCLGNHDRSESNGTGDKSLYDAVFGARDYFFDHGGWRFVSLDSSDRRLTKTQLAWLKGVLAAPGPKVVFTHVPPAFLKGLRPVAEAGWRQAQAMHMSHSHEGEPDHSYMQDFFTNYFKQGSREFDDIVAAGGVKAVYMGHIHAFWAADHRGVRYIISGGGGSPLYPVLPPGYPTKVFAHTLRVTVGPSGLTETVIPFSGRPFVLPPVRPRYEEITQTLPVRSVSDTGPSARLPNPRLPRTSVSSSSL